MTRTQPPAQRIYADHRAEHESCERSTPGCSIDHTAEAARDGYKAAQNSSCDTW